MDELQLRFDELEDNEKEIFLHIACFFDLYEDDYVTNVLNCCGFHADIGLKTLINKSLISISSSNEIMIHHLLKDLGRELVQEKSIQESRRWSRVWLYEQFYNIMSENMEKKVEAIVLSSLEEYNFSYEDSNVMSMIDKNLLKMTNLKLLIINYYETQNFVKISGSLSNLSDELRYVKWLDYPFMYLPLSFHPNQLVVLMLIRSNIKQLWEDNKYLPKLKTLDLSHSENLIKIPDCSEMPNLERLNFEECVKLVQIDPSIGVLENLVFLNLKGCKNTIIPNNILGMSSLKNLNLSGCYNVFKNPWESETLDSSESSSYSQSTSSSILKCTTLDFHSSNPKDLATFLLHSLLRVSCLHTLDISFCGLSKLPDAIGSLNFLEELNLGGNYFVTLPCSLSKLSKLAYLNMQHCKQLESLPQLPVPTTTIEHRRLGWKLGLVIFHCPKLVESERYICMAFSWMIQFVQANIQSSTASLDGFIEIFIPGRQMPIWFNNQSKCDSIRIDPSSIIDDNNVIGLCFCAVFSIDQFDPTGQIPELLIRICSNDYSAILELPSKMSLLNLEEDLIALKSNHVYLCYFPLKSLFNRQNVLDNNVRHLVDFNIKFLLRNGKGLEVQNYGYRWIYKQDQQVIQPNSFNSEVQVFDD